MSFCGGAADKFIFGDCPGAKRFMSFLVGDRGRVVQKSLSECTGLLMGLNVS